MTERKQVLVRPEAVEVAEFWPDGHLTVHLSGVSFRSCEGQATDSELIEYLHKNLSPLRGEQTKEAAK